MRAQRDGKIIDLTPIEEEIIRRQRESEILPEWLLEWQEKQKTIVIAQNAIKNDSVFGNMTVIEALEHIENNATNILSMKKIVKDIARLIINIRDAS